MILPGTTYNERSWAIDLIGHLKQLVGNIERPIKDAGGERTIRTEDGTLFPDVLLFGDRATARILQGWELKMPDTDINDIEFRNNAEAKAKALGLDSFLLWNVSVAQLFVRNQGQSGYVWAKTWDDLKDNITDRASVISNREGWEAMANSIIGDLNSLFEDGVLEGRQFIDSYRSGGITDLILENTGLVEQALKDAAMRDGTLRAEMTLWWNQYQEEYLGTQRELVLAQGVIVNWIAKILFAHILREIDSRARRIADMQDQTTPEQALRLFHQLSLDCNFWTIFSDSLALSSIPEKPWQDLKQFNQLLTDLRVGAVDQQQLGAILEATVEVARRKLRGQYPTPRPLARILTNLCLRDLVSDRILDPCCGSGTIVRAALELKLASDVPPIKAAGSVYAGDQDPQAVVITTFSLADPRFMNVPLRIFQKDAFSLNPTTELSFRNPTDGSSFVERLGLFQAITCNLPFVAQAGRRHYDNAIRDITAQLERDGQEFSGRADIAAYLPFALYPLLSANGRLGIIITNAWLGTAWGDAFYNSLTRYYDLKAVITSGAGRWFQNSKVVTNILIMEKKGNPETLSDIIKFVVLRQSLEDLEEDEHEQIVAAQIELGQVHPETISIRTISPMRLERFRSYGLGGNAQFVNSDWVLELPLVRLREHFQISRGERRGMNALFYPAEGHGIEAEYIRPLVKSPTDFTRLTGEAPREAFSCSRTEEELRALGHGGALNWIERFRTPTNIEKLERSECHWYEMNTDSLTELVMFINYGSRLFVGRLDPPAFVDQRMVRLMPRADIDIGLCHALMNSSIGMFLIEGLGFGRGLGALDLNKDRIAEYMHVIDVSKLNDKQKARILGGFSSLLNREILDVADELEQADRQEFDDQIIKTLGLKVEREQIYDCLRDLVEIRSTQNSQL